MLKVTVKVRVVVPLLPSVTLGESIDNAGAPSSSVMVSAGHGSELTPCVLVAVADTVTVLSGASRLLLTAVMVAVPVVVPAAMVMLLVLRV